MKHLFILLLACTTISLFGQDPISEDAYVPSAPEAAALSKYVDIPVNMYTGTPNINIPLHNVVSRDVSLPISISYHASGNRVTEESSWVGLGWSLNAGGMITREIKDKDDFGFKDPILCNTVNNTYEDVVTELPKGMPNQSSWQYFGEDDSNALLGCGDGGDVTLNCNYTANNGQVYPMSTICDLFNKDIEPDVFTYNVNGYSGKFLYSYNNGEPKYVSLESQAIKIERIPNTLHFEITTPDGVVYRFEETQKTYTNSYSFDGLDNRPLSDGTCTQEYISSWFLTSVRGPGGGNIALNYTKTVETVKPVLGYSETATDGIGYCFETSADNNICDPGGRTMMQMSKNVQDIRYDKVSLNEIDYAPFGKVTFINSNARTDLEGADRLEEIQIFNGNQFFKKIDFSQSYFNSGGIGYTSDFNWHNSLGGVAIGGALLSTRFFDGESPSSFNIQRLRLDSIQEIGHNGTSLPVHSFEYDDLNLPPKSSMKQDIWGFYNGQNNHCLIPNMKLINNLDEGFNGYISQSNDCNAIRTCDPSMIHNLMGSNRESFPGYANANILERINTPTGAFTIFDYEDNQFKIEDLQSALTSNSASVNYHRVFDPNFGRTTTFEILTPPALTQINVLLQYEIEYEQCFQTCDCIGFSNSTTDALQFFIIEITDLGTNNVIITERAINNGSGFDMGTYKQFTIQKSYNLPPGSYKMQLLPTDESPPGPCNSFYDNIISANYTYSWDEFNVVPTEVTKTGAGLRIKSIINNELTKTYSYIDSLGETSGKSINQPLFYKREYSSNSSCVSQGCFAITYQELVMRNSSSYTPLSNSMAGSFIGYSFVEESYGQGGEFGRKASVFHNHETDYDILEYELSNFPGYFDRKNGVTLQEQIYDASDQLVQQTDNIYNKANTQVERQWVPRFHRLFRNTGNANPPCNETATSQLYFYSYTPQWIQLSQSKVTTYGTTGGETLLTTEHTYKPENYQLKSSTVSDGVDQRTTSIYYAGDSGYPEVNFTTNNLLLNQHMISLPVANEIDGGLGGGMKIDYSFSNGLIVPTTFYQRRDALENGSVWKKISEITQFDALAYPENVWRNTLSQEVEYSWTDGLLNQKKYAARTWDYGYDNLRFINTMTNHEGIQATYLYDDLGRLEYSENKNGRIINDIDYNISLALGGDNVVTSDITYSNSIYPIEPLTTDQRFDYFGRPIENTLNQYTFNGNDFVTGTTYDHLGRTESESNPSHGGTSTMMYEASILSRSLSVKPAGTNDQIFTEYNEEGGRVKITTIDENGKQSYQVSDLFGNIIKSVDALGNTTTMLYNNRDQLLQVNPPDNGSPYIYTYYPDGKLKTKTIPNQGTFSYTYTILDQIETESKPDGEVLSYHYDLTYNDFLLGVKLDGLSIIDQDGDRVKGWIETKTTNLLNENPGSNTITCVYTHDDLGRVLTELKTYPEGSISNTFAYDHKDNLITEDKVVTGPDGQVTNTNCTFDYQFGDRLLTEDFSFNGITKQLQNLKYNDNEWLTQKIIGNGIQTIDFAYTNRGWLEYINDPNTINAGLQSTTGAMDVFGMKLNYEIGNATLEAPADKVGNISWVEWKNYGIPTEQYGYAYDDTYRIKQAKYNVLAPNCNLGYLEGAYNMSIGDYDGRGNIKNIVRNGIDHSDACNQVAMIDSLTMNYEGDLLIQTIENIDDVVCIDTIILPSIINQDTTFQANIIIVNSTTVACGINLFLIAKDSILINQDFKMTMGCTPANIYATQGECSTVGEQSFYSLNPGVNYGYSVEGNMEYDPNKDISISYNYLNLPYRITKGDERDRNYILYEYDAEGIKYSRSVYKNGTLTSRKLYFQNFEFVNDTLISVYHSSGRVAKINNSYIQEYEIQDHLGNARVRILDRNGDDQVTIDTSDQTVHELVGVYSYYPFGSQHNRITVMNYANGNFYGYNGKELEGEFDVGMLDYGARWMDPVLGRWTSVDKYASSTRNSRVSVYNYVGNNPIVNIDPDGRDWYKNLETGKVHWEEGSSEIEGYKNIGAKYTIKGKSHTIVHNQNEVVSIRKNNNTKLGIVPFIGINSIPHGSSYLLTGAQAGGAGVLITSLIMYPELKKEELRIFPNTSQFYTSSGTYIRLPYFINSYKRVNGNQEANKVARGWGYEDAHDLKDAHGVGSDYDIYKDGKTGKGELRPHKKGSKKENIPIEPNN